MFPRTKSQRYHTDTRKQISYLLYLLPLGHGDPNPLTCPCVRCPASKKDFEKVLVLTARLFLSHFLANKKVRPTYYAGRIILAHFYRCPVAETKSPATTATNPGETTGSSITTTSSTTIA